MIIQYLTAAAADHKQAVLYLSRRNSVSLMVNGIVTFSQADVPALQAQLQALFRDHPAGAINPRRIVVLGADNPALGWIVSRVFPEASITRLSDVPDVSAHLLRHPHLQMYAGRETIDALSAATPSSGYDLAIFDSVPALSRSAAQDVSRKVMDWVMLNADARFLFVEHKDLARETPRPAPEYLLADNRVFLERLASWSSHDCFYNTLMKCWFEPQCRYPYATDTLLIEFDDLPQVLRRDAALRDWVCTLLSRHHLVVYVNSASRAIIQHFVAMGFHLADYQLQRYVYTYTPQRLRSLQEKLASFPVNELLQTLEATYCAPHEHPAVGQLLEEYLQRHSATFFDQAAEVRLLMEQPALFYLFRDPAGTPIGLVKLINHDGCREAEILFGKGTHRQNVVMLLSSFLEDSKVGIADLEINVPYRHVGTMLAKLGAKPTGEYCVLRRRADAP